jgi:hypothetical protein
MIETATAPVTSHVVEPVVKPRAQRTKVTEAVIADAPLQQVETIAKVEATVPVAVAATTPRVRTALQQSAQNNEDEAPLVQIETKL